MEDQWWCVKDTICNAILAGGGAAALSLCRRLSRHRLNNSRVTELRTTLSISSFCGVMSGGVALIGLEVYPGHPLLILGSVIVVFSVVDPTTDEGRKWFLTKLSAITKVAIQSGAETLRKTLSLFSNDKDDKDDKNN